MNTKIRILVFLTAFLFMIFLVNCMEKTPLEDSNKNLAFIDESQCINCHTNQNLLKEVADPLPDTGGEGSGEG